MRLIDADELWIEIVTHDYSPLIIDNNTNKVAFEIKRIIDNAPTVNLERQSFIQGYKEGCEEGKRVYGRSVQVEVTEHHTFAKPDDVSDLDFPGVSSEDK